MQPELEQLISFGNKLKEELLSAGYKNFSATTPKNDKLKSNFITRKKGQSDQEYYSILFKNAENFDEAIKLYCNNTPYNDLLLTSKLSRIRNILLSNNLLPKAISGNELYDVVKRVSAKINSNVHQQN
ncbi:hypothetical protein [Clostridium drakei]|uniref:Uncharacterized protein n=1 Tax=Clostridium drakei TaxID=332101 RepID=A0A2U8DS11_9CLOT|nr:hypothetical protein [Clostridium drakei]AWI05024.1 hypothetical protein B9W14_11115 [Clostridium drakei]